MKIALRLLTLLLLATISIPLLAQDASQPTRRRAVLEQKIQAQTELRSVLQDAMNRIAADLDSAKAQQSQSTKKQDSIGVSPESFPTIMATLQSQRIQLTIDLAGLKAKREMLAKVQAESESKSNNEVLRPLLKMLNIEKQALHQSRQLQAVASASKSSVLKAERNVLAVEVQIAEVKARSADSSHQTRVNSGLLDVALEHADKQARLDTTEQLLKQLTESRASVVDATNNIQQIDMLQEALIEGQAKIREVEVRIQVIEEEMKRTK